MKKVLICVLVLALTGIATARDHGPAAMTKPQISKPTRAFPPNIPNPQRQGGDTIESAVVVPGLPFATSGTTEGYTNDYDEVCPFGESTAPDVVYALTPGTDLAVTIDLCGSSYDTKLYVYDSGLSLVACNDDFYQDDICGLFTSKLMNVPLTGGEVHYIVVDGYNEEYGDYEIEITEEVPCIVACPTGAYLEGEPDLMPGYVDNYNAGCDAEPDAFQTLVGDQDGNLIFCGVSGWYVTDDLEYRDDDWLVLTAGSGPVEIVADAQEEIYLHEMEIADCDNIELTQTVLAGPCKEATMSVIAAPGETVWVIVNPPDFSAPPGADDTFDYVLRISGLESSVAVEPTTWSNVKALYQ
jgi:hypothetical protein